MGSRRSSAHRSRLQLISADHHNRVQYRASRGVIDIGTSGAAKNCRMAQGVPFCRGQSLEVSPGGVVVPWR